jgi:uncharacterized protein involved in outer membrane biogenesis
MGRKLKTGLLFSAAVLAVLGLCIWYLTTAIDQVKLTRFLSATVKEATGRDLTISGPIELIFFPHMSVVAEGVSLSNASWAADKEMITIKRMELSVSLLPLISKQVEISRIDMHGADIHLQANAAGLGNWILAAPLIQGDAGMPSTAKDSNDDSKSLVSIQSVHVSDTVISYKDNSGHMSSLQIPQLSLTRDGADSVIKVEAKQGANQFGVKGKITSVRKIVSDWNRKPLNILVDLEVMLNGKTLEVNGNIQKLGKTVPNLDLHFKSSAFSLEPLIGASALVASGGQLPATPPRMKTSPSFFFSDASIPFDLLPDVSGQMDFHLQELSLVHFAPLKQVTALILIQKDQVQLQHAQFQLGSGSADLQGSITQLHSAAPVISLKGEAKGYTLGQILKAADEKSKVIGGDMHLAFNLQGAGKSLHQIMANLNGQSQLEIGQATLPSNLINQGGDFMITLLNTINPMRQNSNVMGLECAVAYLPVKNGLVNIADTVGVQTDRLDVTLAGSVNLKDEVIHLDIYPREKSGLTTGLDLANLVQLQGTLQNPKMGINKAGVVNSAVSIGLGFLTGGVSILAENAKSLVTKSDPCKTAFHPWAQIYPAK